MFKCAGCEARKEEIAHLRVIISEMQKGVDSAQRRVLELADPGVNRRLDPARGPLSRGGEGPSRTMIASFPGYEREEKLDLGITEEEGA